MQDGQSNMWRRNGWPGVMTQQGKENFLNWMQTELWLIVRSRHTTFRFFIRLSRYQFNHRWQLPSLRWHVRSKMIKIVRFLKLPMKNYSSGMINQLSWIGKQTFLLNKRHAEEFCRFPFQSFWNSNNCSCAWFHVKTSKRQLCESISSLKRF